MPVPTDTDVLSFIVNDWLPLDIGNGTRVDIEHAYGNNHALVAHIQSRTTCNHFFAAFGEKKLSNAFLFVRFFSSLFCFDIDETS